MSSQANNKLKNIIDIVLDTIVDGVLTINGQGEIQSFNKACVRLFGYEFEEVRGKKVHALMPGLYQGDSGLNPRSSRNTDVLQIIESGREIACKRKNGSVFPIELVIGKAPQGGQHAFVWIIRDISQQRRAEIAQQSSENQLRAVVDNVIDGLITINRKGIIESFNPACEHIFGYESSETIGQNIKMLMPEPYRSEHDGYLKNYHQTGMAKIIGIGREVTGRRKDGSIFPMDLSVSTFQLEDGIHFSGIVRDITERKEAENAKDQLRQAQKMESLGQLTGGIAHDFNNLLAVILGNLDFLQEKTGENSPLREYIEPSIEAALQGSELTQRLLAFGRRQALLPKAVAINEFIENFSGWVHRVLGERVEIITSLERDAWPIYIDPNQLQGALLNLSVNARDAMPDGGKIIYETKNVILDQDYIAHNAFVTPGEYVMVAVSDTGTGMSPEIMEKAFDPFFTTKEIGKGSGLGLSMVYGFVKQSSGHIKLYSEIGHGTSVKIYLPRSKNDISNAVTPSGEPPISPTNKKKTILVVEDNKNVLKLTSSIVESLGFKVLTAETGEQAAEILKKHKKIDLLLTDVMLPGKINGPTLAKQVSVTLPNLKVIFISGYAEHAIVQSGLLEADVHLISKPFRKSQLAKKIEEVLQ